MNGRVVIVGAGQAALSFAAAARGLDADVAITMLGDEPVPPYQRPPLSKAYLAGDMPLDRLTLRPLEWYGDHAIAWRQARATAIDRERREVRLADGTAEPYDALVLATGAFARRLPAAIGGAAANVLTMRTLADADALAPFLREGARMLVVGGGYIGLEAAAVARAHGVEVTLLEAAARILGRVASPVTASYYRALHRSHGVDIRESAALERFAVENGSAVAAVLSNGSRIETDVVVVGIGVEPATALAAKGGLAVDNGIAVDACCRTADPAVMAVGDCASFPHRGARVRLESVPHAIHHAETAAANLLGQPQPYEAKPWFWSDQYDVKLQIAGLNTGYDDTIVREGRREGSRSVWYYRGDELLAVDAMNDAPAFMTARRVIEAGRSPARERVADPAVGLRELA